VTTPLHRHETMTHEGRTMTVTDPTVTVVRPGPGWLVTGAERGMGTPPAPPPAELTDGLLDSEQRRALDDYCEALDALVTARAAMAARRAELDRAVEDDRDAADEAFAAGAGTAPVSVVGVRQLELDRALRHSEAALRACLPALGEVWQQLVPAPHWRALLELAWQQLVDERKQTPDVMRRRVAAVCWALDLGDRLTPNGHASAVVALDAVPVSKWEAGLAEVLDGLGEQVAAVVEQLDELDVP
jgi:hypothetical protein